MKVALILMIKNEVSLLEAWLDYHSQLFGPGSIHLFDNGSTNNQTLSIIDRWKPKLGSFSDSYKTPEDFKNKNEFCLKKVRELESKGYDLFFPMDCDEFIAVETEDGVSTSRLSVFEELDKYKNVDKILRIKWAYDNSPVYIGKYIRSRGQKKCFFFKNICESLDHGYHDATSYEHGLEVVFTNIVYIHHHFREYHDYVRAAKDKLLPWTNEFDFNSLKKFKADSRPGHHLIDRILSDESLYYVDTRERFKLLSNFYLKDFFDFLTSRGHNIYPDEGILEFITLNENWKYHIDSCTVSDHLVSVTGWAFTETQLVVECLRLRFEGTLTEPISFQVINRPDVAVVHPTAPTSCGFSFSFDVSDLSLGEFSGVFLSSTPGNIGCFVEVVKM